MPSSKTTVDIEATTSAPNSPAPIARYKQLLGEHDHLQEVEDSRISKEISSIKQVMKKTKDWEELARTRSQSSGSIKKKAAEAKKK